MNNDDLARYPLTPMQQGMLYQELAEPDTCANIEQVVMRVDEALDVASFLDAFARVLARHDIFRTRFAWEGLDVPCQIVESQVDMPVEQHELRGATDAAVREIVERDARRPFDLTQAPPMRLCLMRLGEQRWQLLWTIHHIAIDGRSFTLVFDELMQLYRALSTDKAVPELAPTLAFRDLVDWYQSRDFTASRAFWREQLKGLSAPTPLPWAPESDAHDPTHQGVDRTIRHLSANTTAALAHLVRRQVLGWAGLLETVWAMLLWRHTEVCDVVFGTTRSGRQGTVEQAGHRVGLFINTVPKRVHIDPQASISDCMQAISDSTRASRAHQHLGLADIQRESGFSAATRLFETLVLYDYRTLNDSVAEHTGDGRWNIQLSQFTGYPLTLLGYGGESLTLELQFDTKLIDTASADALLDRAVVMLEALAHADLGMAMRDLPWLTRRDVDDHLERWNQTARKPGPYLCIYDALSAQAATKPERIALICGERAMSYGELLAHIDALAIRLQQAGVAAGDRVAVAVGRSERMVIATCAIQRVGAAYVPCDPRYPAERLQLMWTDARAGLILTETGTAAGLPTSDLPVLLIDSDESHATPDKPFQPVEITPDLPAHVIFTSGSTGRPKGVVVSHRNVMNFLDSMAVVPGLCADQRILAVTTLSFDIALVELFLPLIVGGASVIADMDEVMDGALLAELIRRHQIDVVQATPTTYRLLRMAGWSPPAHCKAIVGGETLDPALAHDLRANAGEGFVLWNLYGPTETTVYCSGDPVDDGPIHIGTQFDNTFYYVVDGDNRLVAPGVAGELLIGGDCVALGYFDRPELTAKRFIHASVHPDMAQRRLYHSGDRVRWQRLPNGRGRLLFVGRLDNQVKLRGFRIELGEIESVLGQHPQVRQAAVVLRREGGDRLVAYVSLRSTVAGAALREYLADRLPSHMLPAMFVMLDILPMTENGKVDRNALPVPDTQRVDTGKRYIAPRSETERAVARIWCEVLGIADPGIDDNFFDAGGDSLRIVAVRGRIEKELGQALPVAELFQHATVRELARRLDRGMESVDESADTGIDERALKKRAAMARRGRPAGQKRG